MKKLLSILTVLVLVATPQAIADTHPATTAVQFHADWCGGCKILAPKIIPWLGLMFFKNDITASEL